MLLHDGFSYVLRIGPELKVLKTKMSVCRQAGDRIVITGGLDPSERVVESGGSFLGDGDLVRLVEDPVPHDKHAPVSAKTSMTASGQD